MVWRDLSDEVLESVYKPKSIDYVFRCPKCGLETCRCGLVNISLIKPGMDQLVVRGTIIDANEPTVIETKFGRTTLTRAFLQDQTGRVRLNLWGDHADKGQSGAIVRLENAFASQFHDELQVNLGWRGIILLESPPNLAILERNLRYSFTNKDLLNQALTRRSYANEHLEEDLETNEQLAFLGNAVLGLAVSEYLLLQNPDSAEGDLSARVQSLVMESNCAATGMKLNLYNYLRFGAGEKLLARSSGIIAEAYEALIGAIFLDGRYESASTTVKATLLHLSK